MSAGEFAASLLFGFLSVILPLVLFLGMVAACVYIARWWIDRKK